MSVYFWIILLTPHNVIQVPQGVQVPSVKNHWYTEYNYVIDWSWSEYSVSMLSIIYLCKIKHLDFVKYTLKQFWSLFLNFWKKIEIQDDFVFLLTDSYSYNCVKPTFHQIIDCTSNILKELRVF